MSRLLTKSVANYYQKAWKKRAKEDKTITFFTYERNCILPPFFKQKEKVLDLASGSSIVGQHLQKHYNCQVIALDISKKAIALAKKKGVKAIVHSTEKKLPFKKGSFDMVFWGDNIEHLWNPEKTLKEIHRVLKSKARLILSTPNQAYWLYRGYMFLKGAPPKTEAYSNKPWQWEHIRFFNKTILKELLSLTGFKITKFAGTSRRIMDRPFYKLMPELFASIIVIEARKI